LSSKSKYIIGTRGSLLALTQTENVRQNLIKATGLEFEIKVIKTVGDLQTDKPLWQLKGENFFTRELDEALINKEVDLVVHSFKDLGGERPKEITLAAVPQRNFPHDILLIKNETIKKLSQKEKIIIGTSSPRRIYLSQKVLPQILPYGKQLQIETALLRGNVNTRLQKLMDGDFDAIILALAGLERLASHPDSMQELKKIIHDLNFMLLPITEFTPSAAQGALAIECRTDDEDLFKKIQLISHDESKKEALYEKKLFAHYGGGCHQAVGVLARSHPRGQIEIHRGEKDGKEIIKSSFQTKREEIVSKNTSLFIGLSQPKEKSTNIIYDELSLKEEMSPCEPMEARHFFVTSPHCLSMFKKVYKDGPIWAAGFKTMTTLSGENYWTNGCADFHGAKELDYFLQSEFLSLLLPQQLSCVFLTSKDNTSNFSSALACYERAWKKTNDEFREKIMNCCAYYWTSYSQFEHYKKEFPQIENAFHACGLGKTSEAFLKNNIHINLFVSINEFKEWFYEQTK